MKGLVSTKALLAVSLLIGISTVTLLFEGQQTTQLQKGILPSSDQRDTVTTAISRPLPAVETLSITHNVSKQKSATSGYCTGKNAILLIQKSDPNAAVGTLFYTYVTNHLIYAELFNLVPWVHLDPIFPCYDASVHDGTINRTFTAKTNAQESGIYGEGDLLCKAKRPKPVPGPLIYPEWLKDNTTDITLIGNGIWPTYFEEIGSFDLLRQSDPSCTNLPILQLNETSVYPGIHVCAPWAVRSWLWKYVPPALRPGGNISYQLWFTPMRRRASKIVSKYYRPQPWLKELAAEANPVSPRCLSIHIRLTDKGNQRNKKSISVFQPYAEAYSRASSPSGSIYVATDDSSILHQIQSNWTINKLSSQPNVLRSEGLDPIFLLYQNETHRSNTEGLVDVLAMAKCDFFLHGFSAMAEGVIYMNPALHERSVNIDIPTEEMISVQNFEMMVNTFYDKSE